MEYSVIIRTTGKAGEKYAKLLRSICALAPLPTEIIVVLPEGYAPPPETLGTERICYCQKGMVTQRLYGAQQCKTRYALFTDDDIAFAPDFVEKLYRPLANGDYSFSAGPLLSFFPRPGMQTAVSTLLGTAAPTVFHGERYNTVLKTTGYSFNRNIKVGSGAVYETQSAPWTCFFTDMEAMRGIHFEDELWLDRHGYSAHDDTAMFYKAWLCGYRTAIVADAPYAHLDAKTSTRGNGEKVAFASGFNTVVFWHRFLYSPANTPGRLWCKTCLEYGLVMQRLWNQFNCMRGKATAASARAYQEGARAGKVWVASEEYAKLPPIRR